MKPADLRTLLEKASPRPWRMESYLTPDAVVDVHGEPIFLAVDRKAIVALVNHASLLIELWQQAIKLAEDEDCWVGFYEALGKLEKS